jgi:fatty-acyl-CoA synthase
VTGPTVQALLAASFRRHRGDPCLLWEGGEATFGETAGRVTGVASWIAGHVGDLRHVAIVLPNGRAYIESILACTLASAVRIPLSAREPLELIAAKLTESSAEVLIATSEIVAALEGWIRDTGCPAVAVGEGALPPGALASFEQLAAAAASPVPLSGTESDRYRLSFTGGTTGVPKAVVQTHRQERALIRNLLLEVVQPGPASTFVAATPLSHAAGAFVLPAVLAGGSVSWLEHFDPARLTDASWLGETAAARTVETFVVPTAMADLVSAAARSHDLHTVVYGGAPCPAPVLSAALDRLGDQALVQVYGQAEAPMTICVASRADHSAGLVTDGWVGHPFMFVEVSVGTSEESGDQVGELIVRAEHVMEGYWRRPEETAGCLGADGALRTGDVGRIESDGSVRIVGRVREMLISGGFNVYPDDVERRLRQAGLNDVPISVFGIAHPRWGEAVVLAAACPPDTAAATRERVRAAADEALAYYERPKEIFIVSDLPLTPVGKVARQTLASRFSSAFAGHE